MISLVTPAHNEAKNLPKLVESANHVLKNLGKYEIIVVNDNSNDNTLQVLDSLKKKFKNLVCINRTKNPGVGFAIREGLAKAKGDIIITMDADLSHNPREIPKFLKLLGKYDMVCGSRYIIGGRANMGLSRMIVSGLFNLLFRKIIGIPVKDFTSGYRSYKSIILKKISLDSQKFGIFIEIPIKAHLAGFNLTEIPITYHKRRHGKSNLNYFKQGPEYIKVALEALKIRFIRLFS